MAKNKYTKKRILKTQEENQGLLIYLSEQYMSVVLANNFDYESPEAIDAFTKLDKQWRDHARSVINKFPRLYDDQKRRVNLTTTFSVQVRKLRDTVNKPINQVINKEEEFNWKEQPVEKIIEAFKITLSNYTSKARTIPGLTKVYETLELDQQTIFEGNLKELVSTT